MAAPRFSELFHTGKMDELFHVAKKSTKLILWTTTPIMLALLLFGVYILRYLYGDVFTVSYPALVILLIGYFISMASGVNGLFMNMTGNQKTFRNIMLFAAGANIGLNVILIPALGIYGAALATTISLSVWNITTLICMKRKFGRTTGYFPFWEMFVREKKHAT
jgi:O-antigen/teichoic acid export membrane protein